MDNLNNIKAALPSKRTLLVVDGAYLMISAQKIHLKINYMKLVNELERILGCEFYEKWFINGGEGPNANNSPFNNMLRAAPPAGPQFRVKILGMKNHTSYCKHCRREVDSRVQKGVDVSIATLILKHAFQNHCDQIVLIAGDGDFYEALSTAKDELRKDLVLAGFQDVSLSLDLQQLANKVIWINSLIDLIRDVPQQPQPHLQAQPVSSQMHILQQQQQMPMPQQQMPIPPPQQQQVFMQPPIQQQVHSVHQLRVPAPQYPAQSHPQPHQVLQTPQNLAMLQQQPMPQQFLPQVPHQQQHTQQQLQQKQTNWPCTICTFSNQPHSNYCEICASPRPSPTSPTMPAPTIPSPTPIPSAISSPIPIIPMFNPTPTPSQQVPVPISQPVPQAVPQSVLQPVPHIPHVPQPTSQAVPGSTNHGGFFGQLMAMASSVAQPTSTPSTPNKLPPAAHATPEGLFPCPLCTFHRKSNTTCEMCGYS